MMEAKKLFNGGQRRIYKEGEIPPVYERLPYDRCEVLTDIAPLELHRKFADKGLVTTVDVTELILGVTAEMIDWWWGNLEKGYHLWAPGEHYGFEWIVPPCEVGYEGSVEASYEFDPVHPMVITRVSMENYPYTTCFEHCWIAKGYLGPAETTLVHMYEDTEGGILWRTVQIMKESDLRVLKERNICMPDTTSHLQYESGRLRYFLPQLYDLWKDHPDPYQNIHFDLRVEKTEDGCFKHKYRNIMS